MNDKNNISLPFGAPFWLGWAIVFHIAFVVAYIPVYAVKHPAPKRPVPAPTLAPRTPIALAGSSRGENKVASKDKPAVSKTTSDTVGGKKTFSSNSVAVKATDTTKVAITTKEAVSSPIDGQSQKGGDSSHTVATVKQQENNPGSTSQLVDIPPASVRAIDVRPQVSKADIAQARTALRKEISNYNARKWSALSNFEKVLSRYSFLQNRISQIKNLSGLLSKATAQRLYGQISTLKGRVDVARKLELSNRDLDLSAASSGLSTKASFSGMYGKAWAESMVSKYAIVPDGAELVYACVNGFYDEIAKRLDASSIDVALRKVEEMALALQNAHKLSVGVLNDDCESDAIAICDSALQQLYRQYKASRGK